jgi:hypothetical protein
MYYGTASEVTHSLTNDAALQPATDLLIQVQPGFPTADSPHNYSAPTSRRSPDLLKSLTAANTPYITGS